MDERLTLFNFKLFNTIIKEKARQRQKELARESDINFKTKN